MQQTTRTEFADAVGAAIAGVRHFYREVDRLVAGIRDALRSEPEPLKVMRGSTGKGSSAKQHGRVVLRDEYAILFEPDAEQDEALADDPEDDDDEEGDEPEDEPQGGKRKSAPIELEPDQPLLALRLSLSTPQPVPGFEPSLQYAVLGDWWVSGVRPDDAFVLKRYMLRRIPVILGHAGDQAKRIKTRARVSGKGKGSKGGDRFVSCRILGGVHAVALYDLDEPKALDALAIRMKEHWHNVSEQSTD